MTYKERREYEDAKIMFRDFIISMCVILTLIALGTLGACNEPKKVAIDGIPCQDTAKVMTTGEPVICDHTQSIRVDEMDNGTIVANCFCKSDFR